MWKCILHSCTPNAWVDNRFFNTKNEHYADEEVTIDLSNFLSKKEIRDIYAETDDQQTTAEESSTPLNDVGSLSSKVPSVSFVSSSEPEEFSASTSSEAVMEACDDSRLHSQGSMKKIYLENVAASKVGARVNIQKQESNCDLPVKLKQQGLISHTERIAVTEKVTALDPALVDKLLDLRLALCSSVKSENVLQFHADFIQMCKLLRGVFDRIQVEHGFELVLTVESACRVSEPFPEGLLSKAFGDFKVHSKVPHVALDCYDIPFLPEVAVTYVTTESIDLDVSCTAEEFERIITSENQGVHGRLPTQWMQTSFDHCPVVIFSYFPEERPPKSSTVYRKSPKTFPIQFLPLSFFDYGEMWLEAFVRPFFVQTNEQRTPEDQLDVKSFGWLLEFVVCFLNNPHFHRLRAISYNMQQTLQISRYPIVSDPTWSQYNGEDYLLHWKVQDDGNVMCMIEGATRADLLKVFSLTLECEYYRDWIPFIMGSERIKDYGFTTFGLNLFVALPWPMYDREATILGLGADLITSKLHGVVLSGISVHPRAFSVFGTQFGSPNPNTTRIHFKKFVAMFTAEDPNFASTTARVVMYMDPFFPVVPKKVQGWMAKAVAPRLFHNIQQLCNTFEHTVYPSRMRAQPQLYDHYQNRIEEGKKYAHKKWHK